MTTHEIKCCDCGYDWEFAGDKLALFDQSCPGCGSDNWKQTWELTRVTPGIPSVVRDTFTKKHGRSYTLGFDPSDREGIAEDAPTLASAINEHGDVTFESRTQRDRAHREIKAVKDQCEEAKGLAAEEARSAEMKEFAGSPFHKACKKLIEPNQPLKVG